MSPSIYIRPRTTKRGEKRYHVRYQEGGRGSPERHVGVKRTLGEARELKRWADKELAAGRAPDLNKSIAKPPTVAEFAERYKRNVATGGTARQKTVKQAMQRLGALGRISAAEVEVADVQDWILTNSANQQRGKALAPSSLRTYLGVIAKVLDLAGVEPNPARSRLLVRPRPPKERPPDPPSYREFTGMLTLIGLKQMASVTVLEGTGLRIHELAALTWGDVDWKGGRIRVAVTKGNTAGMRFIPLAPWVEDVLVGLMAPDDRIITEPVFPPATENAVYKAMRRATKDRMRRFTPHDLRDRYISLLNLAGIPLPLIRDIAGHTRNTVTLDIYTHVLLDEPQWRLDELRRAVGRMTGLAADVPAPVRPGASPSHERGSK